MIETILNFETVDTMVEAKDWKQAVTHAGRLLVDAGYAEERYISSMLEVVEEFGPYIVILPGVALAHARPDGGAKKIGLSLISLKEPVEFGNEVYDPVKLVFALCATDNHSHLELIQEISLIFDDQDKLMSLSECQSKEEMLGRIHQIISEAPGMEK